MLPTVPIPFPAPGIVDWPAAPEAPLRGGEVVAHATTASAIIQSIASVVVTTPSRNPAVNQSPLTLSPPERRGGRDIPWCRGWVEDLQVEVDRPIALKPRALALLPSR